MQHQDGFLLPLLKQDQGYGQFINRNHFAYLMEMGFGVVVGLVAIGGAAKERLLIYLGALLPIWSALVLSNSRGGIVAMVVQLIATLLLFPAATPRRKTANRDPDAYSGCRCCVWRCSLFCCSW